MCDFRVERFFTGIHPLQRGENFCLKPLSEHPYH